MHYQCQKQMTEPNEIRIARLHLKNAIERKTLRPLGSEDFIIDLCKQRIAEYENAPQNIIQYQQST